MKVFLAQTKPCLGDIEKNLKGMIEIINTQIKNKGDLVVFPELSLTGYLLEDLVFDVAIKSVPQELLELSKKISIVFGAVELGEDLYHYNTAYYLEDGEVIHRHRKVYLPTYGLFDEGRYFKDGDRIKAFNTKHGRVGMLICEDAFHQSSSYILGQDGVETILVLTNSPVRITNEGLEIRELWESICKSIAVGNSCNVVMVNRVGIEDGVSFWGGSFSVLPSGTINKKLSLMNEDGETVVLDKKEIVKVRFASGSSKSEKIDLVLSELVRIKKSR